jgi:hypothetical protein
MATGASTADLAILLVDARNGVAPVQTPRANCQAPWHQSLRLAINKMTWSINQVFGHLRRLRSCCGAPLHLPANGDNVLQRRTPVGPEPLHYLET